MNELDFRSIRAEQAEKIMQAIERCLAAGREVRFTPTGGCATVTVTPMGARVGLATVRKDARDAAAHVLQCIMSDLDDQAREHAELWASRDADEEQATP